MIMSNLSVTVAAYVLFLTTVCVAKIGGLSGGGVTFRNFCDGRKNNSFTEVGKCEYFRVRCVNNSATFDLCATGQIARAGNCIAANTAGCPANSGFCRNPDDKRETLQLSPCVAEYAKCELPSRILTLETCTEGIGFIEGICTPSDHELAIKKCSGKPPQYPPAPVYPKPPRPVYPIPRPIVPVGPRPGYGNNHPVFKRIGDIPVSKICHAPNSAGPYQVKIGPDCGTLLAHCNKDALLSFSQCRRDSLLTSSMYSPTPVCVHHEPCLRSYSPFQGLLTGAAFCKTLSDGIYAPSACSPLYAICHSGAAYTYQCAEHFAINVLTGKCVPTSDLTDCQGGGAGYGKSKDPYSHMVNQLVAKFCQLEHLAGFHPAEKCSRGFIDCVEPSYHTCSDHFVFSPYLFKCVEITDTVFDCVDVIPKKSDCDAVKGPERYEIPHPCGRGYSLCVEGHSVSLVCPRLHTFDPDQRICVPIAYKKECVKKLSGFQPLSCMSHYDGFVGAHSQCSKYYECLHGKAVARKCPYGTGFDPGAHYGKGGCVHLSVLQAQGDALKCKLDH